MTAPTAAPTAVAMVARYAAATQLTRSRLLGQLLTLWTGVGGTRDAQAAAFVDQAVPLVLGGQQAMAALTSAYLMEMDTMMTGAAGGSGIVGTVGESVGSSVALRAADLAGLRRGTAGSSVVKAVGETVGSSVVRRAAGLGPTGSSVAQTVGGAVGEGVALGLADFAGLRRGTVSSNAARVVGETVGSRVTLGATELARLRGGTPADVVYQRPFVTVWTALSQGKPYDQAVAAGQRRLVDLAATDLQLAKTHQAQATFSTMGGVVGYRRVLTGQHSCGLCVVASTQRYHKADLMPIHPGCDCGIAPIHGHSDPGQTIDAGILLGDHAPDGVTAHGVEIASAANVQNVGDVLGPVHQAIEDRFGVSDAAARMVDYRKALVTHEHGEIGPVLALAGQNFTGPADI